MIKRMPNKKIKCDGKKPPRLISALSAKNTMTYKLTHPEAKPPILNTDKVPFQFHDLIPLAEKYGISDDCYRTDLIETLDENELKECASFLDHYDQVLDDWLAGPEADGPNYSQEYITFSALGMAADEAKMKLEGST